MTLEKFEHGKSRIMSEARAELRRAGIQYHSVMFESAGTKSHAEGETLTVSADGRTVSAFFRADEIEDSQQHVGRPDVRQKIARLIDEVQIAAA